MHAGNRQAISKFRECGFFIAIAAVFLIVAPWLEPAVGKEPGWLGVRLTTVTPTTRLPKGLSLASGALVVSVLPNSPAANADLRPGDVIVAVNDRKIATADELLKYLDELGTGSSVTVTRARAGGGQAAVPVVLVAKPDSGEAKPRTASPPSPQVDRSGPGEPPKAPAAKDRGPSTPVPDRATSRNKTFGQPPAGGEPMAPSSTKPQAMPGYSGTSPTIGGHESVLPPVGAEGGMAAPSRSSGSSAPYKTVPKNGGSVIKKRSFEYRAPTEETPPTGLSRGEQPYTTVKVFYATDRNKTDSQDPVTMYGADRGALRYGTCDVTVPKDHRIGELEAPS